MICEKRGLFLGLLILFVFALVPLVHAEIVVQGPDVTRVNFGDSLTLSGHVLRAEDTVGLLTFSLVCDQETPSILHVMSITVQRDVKKDFTETLSLAQLSSGTCNIIVKLTQQGTVLEETTSSTFSVTSDLVGSFTLTQEQLRVGEPLLVTGEVFKQDGSSVDGFGFVTLKKEDTVYASEPIVFDQGILDHELSTVSVPSGTYTVTVEARDGFGNHALFSLGTVVISSDIAVLAHSDKGNYLPGEKVKITGTAEGIDGKLKRGEAYVAFNDLRYESTVRRGSFSLSFPLAKDISSGMHDVTVSVEDDVGGFGSAAFSLLVDPIPTEILLLADKSAVQPSDVLDIKATLRDQAGATLTEDLVITLTDKKKNGYFESVKTSNEQFSITLDQYIKPGNYFIKAVYGDVVAEHALTVGDVVILSYTLDGQQLIVENTGNVMHEAPLTIQLTSSIGQRSISETLELAPGSMQQFDLGLGTETGVYTVTVADQVFENVSITYVKKTSYAWIGYVFVILLLLFVLYWLFNQYKGNRFQRRTRSPRPRKRKRIWKKKGALYGGAPLNIKDDEEHVQKFRSYMGRLVSFKKKPLRFSLRKQARDDVHDYVPTKKGSMVRDRNDVKKDEPTNIFGGIDAGWGRKEDTYETKKSKKKDDNDDAQGGLFNMFG